MASNTPPGPPPEPTDDKKKKSGYLTTDKWLNMTPSPKKGEAKSKLPLSDQPTDDGSPEDDDLVLIDDIPPPTLPHIELPPVDGTDPLDSKTISRLIDVPDGNADSGTISRLIDVPSDVWNKLAVAGTVPSTAQPPSEDEVVLDVSTLAEAADGGPASAVIKSGPKTAPVDPADVIASQPMAPPGVGSGWLPSGTKLPRPGSTADIDLPPTRALRDEPSDIFSTARPPAGGSSDLFGGSSPPSAAAGSNIFADDSGAPVPGGRSDIFSDPSGVVTGGESDLFAHLPGVTDSDRGSSRFDDPARKTDKVPYPPATPRPSDPFGGMVQLDDPATASPDYTSSTSGGIEIIDTGTGFTGRHLPLPLSASDLPLTDPLADIRSRLNQAAQGAAADDPVADLGVDDDDAPRLPGMSDAEIPMSDPLPVPLPRSDPEMPDFDEVDREAGSNLFGDATVLDMELGMQGLSGVNLADPEGAGGAIPNPRSSIFNRSELTGTSESNDQVDFAVIPIMGSSDERTESMLYPDPNGPASGIFNKNTVAELGDLDAGGDDGAGLVSFDPPAGKGGSRRMPFQDSGGMNWSNAAGRDDADQRTMGGAADGEDAADRFDPTALDSGASEKTSRTKIDDESVFSAGDIDPDEFGLPPDPNPADASNRLPDAHPMSGSRPVSVASRNIPVAATTRRPAASPVSSSDDDDRPIRGQNNGGGGKRGLLLAGLGLVAGGVFGAGGMYLGGGSGETKTGPVAGLNQGNTPAPAPAAAANDAPAASLLAADPAAALAGFLKEADSPATQAGRGQARWLARARAAAAQNQRLNPADPELTQAKADLQAVLKAAAELPANQQQYAVQAGLHLGLIDEATAQPEKAIAAYKEAAGLLPAYRKVFDAAVQRVTIMRKRSDSSPITDYSLRPADAADLGDAARLITFAPVAEIEDEAGFHFWQAVNYAADWRAKDAFKNAAAAMDKARATHAARRMKLLGRGLNPLSDPSEQMFLRAADELAYYYRFKGSIYNDPDGMKLASNGGTGTAIKTMLDAYRKVASGGGGADPKELADAKAATTKAQADLRAATEREQAARNEAEAQRAAVVAAEKKATDTLAELTAKSKAADAAVDVIVAKLKDAKLIDTAADRTAALAALPAAMKKAAIISGGSGDKMAELADALARAKADADAKVKEATDALAKAKADADAKLKDADARVAAAKDAETKAKAEAAEATKGGDAKVAAAIKIATEKATADAKSAIEAERVKTAEAVTAASRATAERQAEVQKYEQKMAAMTAEFGTQLAAVRNGAAVRISDAERDAADRGAKLYADGVRAYFENRHADAEGYLTAALRESDADARAWYFLGLTKFAVGRTGEAATDFRTGAQWESKTKPGRRAVATALERVQGAARQAVEAVRP